LNGAPRAGTTITFVGTLFQAAHAIGVERCSPSSLIAPIARAPELIRASAHRFNASQGSVFTA
jgi:hypothetical protein